MIETVTIPEIAKRIGVDMSTVRRLIAKEAETLGLTLQRGKQDR